MLDNERLFLDLNNDFMRILQDNKEWKKIQAFGKSLAFLESDASVKISANRMIKLGVSYTDTHDKGFMRSTGITYNELLPLAKWVLLNKYGIKKIKTIKEAMPIAFRLNRMHGEIGSHKYRNPTNMYPTVTLEAMSNFKKNLINAYITKLNSI